MVLFLDDLSHRVTKGIARSETFIKIHLFFSINSRHLALEPLCCIQSCKIRSGCVAVGVFEGIGVFCILAYAMSQLKRIFSRGGDYNNIRTYADFGENPAPYLIIAILCFIWLLCIVLFLVGVRKFHVRLVQMHLVIQAIAAVVCVIIVVAVSVQLSLPAASNTYSQDTVTTSLPITTSTFPATNVSDSSTIQRNSTRRRLTEQLGLLTCSLYLLAVEVWGVTVVYDCYKYFKLCQVLVNLATSKGRNPAQTAGQVPTVSGNAEVLSAEPTGSVSMGSAL